MAERTITRAQLSESVYQEVGLSRNESADLLEMVLGEIASALTRGESVKISSFGSFSIRSKGQRVGRNPKTGEEVPILPRRVLVFRPSQLLKSRINDGVAAAAGAAPSGSAGANPTSAAPPVGGAAPAITKRPA
jgi:integration host factor subunit alpha